MKSDLNVRYLPQSAGAQAGPGLSTGRPGQAAEGARGKSSTVEKSWEHVSGGSGGSSGDRCHQHCALGPELQTPRLAPGSWADLSPRGLADAGCRKLWRLGDPGREETSQRPSRTSRREARRPGPSGAARVGGERPPTGVLGARMGACEAHAAGGRWATGHRAPLVSLGREMSPRLMTGRHMFGRHVSGPSQRLCGPALWRQEMDQWTVPPGRPPHP